MEKKVKIILSHQNQCDDSEIKKLIEHLEKNGFEVISGTFDKSAFEEELSASENYVCILESNSHKSAELAAEIEIAVSQGKKIFAIFCPSISGLISVPTAVDNFASGVTEWNIEKITKALEGEDIGFTDQEGNPKKPIAKVKKKPC